jgi:hypothetical protein
VLKIRPTKWLAFAFWEMKRVFKSYDGFDEFAALTLRGGIELAGVVTVLAVISVIVGYRILPASTMTTKLLGTCPSSCVGSLEPFCAPV